uniref:RRM domain-containing protein n=1 Tax=Oryza meridionalis TaxID=40149 RepID=A0A0E0EE05_9ORYZ
MKDSHELDDAIVVVNRTTPKDEDVRYPLSRTSQGVVMVHIMHTFKLLSDMNGQQKDIFVGRLPQEANTEDLKHYFGKFGRITHAYISKIKSIKEVDIKEVDIEILKIPPQEIGLPNKNLLAPSLMIDTTSPLEGYSGGGYMEPRDLYGAYGSMPTYGSYGPSGE